MAADPSSFGIASRDDIVSDPAFQRFYEAFDFSKIASQVDRDLRLLRASGRWNPGTDDPENLLPGDAPIVRGVVAGAHLAELGARLRGLVPESPEGYAPGDVMAASLASVVSALDSAVPFYIDGPTAMGVLSSTPPDAAALDTLRLPFDSVFVMFGHEIEIPADVEWPDNYNDYDPADEDLPWTGFRTTMESALVHRGGAITGMVLISGPNGVGLGDFMLWIVSANPDPEHPQEEMRRDRQRSSILAYRKNSTWQHMIDNTAAAVAWLDWEQPDPLDLPDPASKLWRKAIRTSQFRKREPRGAAGDVHVIARRPAEDSGPGSDDEPKTSRRSHIRTGHWRSVRIATRDEDGTITGDTTGEPGVDWHYEGRWIAPTIVNAGATPDDRAVVYRVPPTG